jgi:KaiC/GvpD/RAD55 family RecA-like ATPase
VSTQTTSSAERDLPATLAAALSYVARGWRVIPIAPGTKHPDQPAWPRAASADPGRVRHWWTNAPDHGVGIVTGRASGIFVLDVDVSDGKGGDETLAELEARHGGLPPTFEVITGSGGRHLYFHVPSGADIRNDAGRRLGPGLDIRGEGGQVLAPPTIHPNGHRYEVEASAPATVAEPPPWLVDLLVRTETPSEARPAPGATGERPGDLWAAATSWAQLLQPDGWTLHHVDRSGEEHWTRPGKTTRDGTSATVNYGGSDTLKVFTSSLAALGLVEEQTYSKLGYLAATRFAGDHHAAARALARAGYRVPPVDLAALIVEPDDEPDDGTLPLVRFDHAFWNREQRSEWLIEPIIPTGRHVVLYAPAKAGKSLLALEIAAAAATGRPILGQAPGEPTSVLYVDMEMTEDDLAERLSDFGYDEGDDLSRLHYSLLPSLAPLDTPAGAETLLRTVRRWRPQLVVIDTMARAVAGEENDADTYRHFDMYTSRALKRAGVAVFRLDHTGKDPTKGQRGSSEKVGYADLVWRLTYGEDQTGTLTATHQRVSWVPSQVPIRRVDEPATSHRLTQSGSWPSGTKELAEVLEQLGAPIDCSTRDAQRLLKAAGQSRRRALVVAAVKWRRQRTPSLDDLVADHSRNHPQNHVSTTPIHPRNHPPTDENRSGSPGTGNQTNQNDLTRTGTVPEPQEPPPLAQLGTTPPPFREGGFPSARRNQSNQPDRDDPLGLFDPIAPAPAGDPSSAVSPRSDDGDTAGVRDSEDLVGLAQRSAPTPTVSDPPQNGDEGPSERELDEDEPFEEEP